MNRIFITLLTLGICASTEGQQVFDVVTTGSNYENQVWYSLQNGEVHSAPKDNWDLAFEISGFSSSIRYNAQKGLQLYAAPYSISEWGAVDIAAVDSWTMLYDDPTSWKRGAFNQHLASDFDLGWGIYNMITHIVSGDSIYVLKFANNSYKKLRIDQLAQGTYTFTHANIDGTDETSAQLVKSNFTGKNFGYYRFDENTTFDREPASATWDLTFTRYTDMLNMGGGESVPYPVAGVLHNYTKVTAEATGTPVEEAEPENFDFVFDINTIGYDWKSFNGSGFDIAENQSYFIQDTAGGSVYQIFFTGFGGSADGTYEFTISESGTVGLTDAQEAGFIMFPNPSTGGDVRLNWENGMFAALNVFDLTGKLVQQYNLGLNVGTHLVETSSLSTGTYIIQLAGSKGIISKKLIITN